MDERLEKIESKISLAEDLLDSLNQTIYQHQRDIDILKKQITLLFEQLQAIRPLESPPLANELPPHY
ncbi:MAG: SlyX family protein [Betaproteobacteria bacterium]|jgi:SlyX protein